MIKIQPIHRNQSSIASFSSLHQSHHYRGSVQLAPLCIDSLRDRLNRHPSKTIVVYHSQFEKQKQTLQWRQNTDFPIVKIKSFKVLNEKHTLNSKFYEILVKLQSQMKSFQQMKKLPFFQAIYVLKESIIGFQRLCHKFRFFEILAEMIMFNENQNCRVWVNKNCFSNNISSSHIKSEKEFILELSNIVQSRTLKSKKSIQFFERIKKCKYFFEGIGSIDEYAKINKIKIPTKLQNLQDSKSPLFKSSLNMDFKSRQNYQKNSLIRSKVPYFIQKNKVKKTISYDKYSPMPRKMTVGTQECIHELSQTNITRNHSSYSFLKDTRVEQNQTEFQEQDSFLKEMNIRLIEPNAQKSKDVFIPSSFNLPSEYDNSMRCPFSPMGTTSEIDFNQDKKSAFSFNKCISKQQISTFECAEKMYLTVAKQRNYEDTYSTLNKIQQFPSPKNIKTFKNLDVDQQSLEDFQPLEIKEKKYSPLTINQIKQKRKFSGDFGNLTTRQSLLNKLADKSGMHSPQYKTQNVLNFPFFPQPQNNLTKSPSHQTITRSRRRSINPQQQNQQKEQREFLRETIMNKNGWRGSLGLELIREQKSIQQSFVDDEQIPEAQPRSKTSELPILGVMGRNVRSSIINAAEFQLEYGEKIQKAEEIKNELVNLLG